MEIRILSYTPNPELIVALAARQSWSSKKVEDLKKELTPEKVSSFLRKLYKMHHLSPFEHANFTFLVEGISRVTSHQLVRHRIASYTQQSQRHVEVTEGKFVVPETIKNKSSTHSLYTKAVKSAVSIYKKLINEGVPLEDARYVLPSSVTTRIIFTMNARELLHFFKLRTCIAAQWEIRKVAEEMLKLVKEIAPNLFYYAGPPCVEGICPEKKFCELFKKYYKKKS